MDVRVAKSCGAWQTILATTALIALAGCASNAKLDPAQGTGPSPTLPEPRPESVPTVHIAEATGWPAGVTPSGAPGTRVVAFASGLDHPRWLHVLPNGDVLVAETAAPDRPEEKKGLRNKIMGSLMREAGSVVPSANRITLLRDADGDGVAEQRSVFVAGLTSPFGMALVGDDFYVANTDSVVRFHYTPGATKIDGAGTPVASLPAGPRNHHWTKSLIASPDGRKLYATVGSNSNAAEHGMAEEQKRAAIWEIDRATGASRLFATGLRNPNGMAWVPETGALWTAVNERDELGGDLVPDYMTSVRDGGFYGWPYSYYGQHVDARVEPQDPGLVAKAIVPDYALGPHTASLGLAYALDTALPAQFQTGMFVGQHGSWNRRPRSGYKVIFVPFRDGHPAGTPLDVLTGFVAGDDARGRPVGVALDRRGALLVADDVGNTVWRVTSATSTAQ
jgi:glucose/arabinose dehydrogenase